MTLAKLGEDVTENRGADGAARRIASRSVRLDVLWAIRDSRDLKAPEKALLWAVESRGVHYGTWRTVAADAGMKKDAYYAWRARLEAKGALRVTERPGRTTVHEVNAEWFGITGSAESHNGDSGKSEKTFRESAKDPSEISVMKENPQGDPLKGTPSRGPLKETLAERTSAPRVRDSRESLKFLGTNRTG